LRELKIYLSAKGVNISQDVDWMGKFNSFRKIIRGRGKEIYGPANVIGGIWVFL
jgi:hypothetical protein